MQTDGILVLAPYFLDRPDERRQEKGTTACHGVPCLNKLTIFYFFTLFLSLILSDLTARKMQGSFMPPQSATMEVRMIHNGHPQCQEPPGCNDEMTFPSVTSGSNQPMHFRQYWLGKYLILSVLSGLAAAVHRQLVGLRVV